MVAYGQMVKIHLRWLRWLRLCTPELDPGLEILLGSHQVQIGALYVKGVGWKSHPRRLARIAQSPAPAMDKSGLS